MFEFTKNVKCVDLTPMFTAQRDKRQRLLSLQLEIVSLFTLILATCFNMKLPEIYTLAEIPMPVLRPTRAEIDLAALRHNFQEIQRTVGAGCDILAVVKADAYGQPVWGCPR
jgi:hypothetical protein